MHIDNGYLNEILAKEHRRGKEEGIVMLADKLYQILDDPEFDGCCITDGNLYFNFKCMKEAMETLLKEVQKNG